MELLWRNAQGLGVLHPLGPGDSIHVHEPHDFDWPVAALFEGVPSNLRPAPGPSVDDRPAGSGVNAVLVTCSSLSIGLSHLQVPITRSQGVWEELPME